MTRTQVAVIIDDLVRFWKQSTRMSAARINKGWCGDFAADLTKELPGSTVQWNYHYPHAYVSYRRRYYDSETPFGVLRMTDLPCIQRLIQEEKLTNERIEEPNCAVQVASP